MLSTEYIVIYIYIYIYVCMYSNEIYICMYVLLGFVIVGFAITYCFHCRLVGVVAMVVRCGLHEVVVGFAVVDGGVVVTMIFFFFSQQLVLSQ